MVLDRSFRHKILNAKDKIRINKQINKKVDHLRESYRVQLIFHVPHPNCLRNKVES